MEKFIPEELVIEILSRLPATSAFRFCSVSKQWCRLITTDEYFLNLHFQHQRSSRGSSSQEILLSTTQFLAMDEEDEEQEQPVLSFWRPGSTDHRVIKLHPPCITCFVEALEYVPSTTCNGLVCLAPRPSHYRNSPQHPIVVCNPLTHEYVTLPPYAISGVTCTSGLGYALISKQYKVVCITSSYAAPFGYVRGDIMVYTLGSDRSWRVLQKLIVFQPNLTRQSPLYVDGKIYMLVRMYEPFGWHCDIWSFDVETEEATVIPGILETRSCDYQLASLGGCSVSLFLNTQEEISVWVLTSGGVGDHHWHLRHVIKPPDGRLSLYLSMVGVSELGDGTLIIVMESCILRYDGRAATFTGQVADPGADDTDDPLHNWYVCRGYNPSLVSLRKFGGRVGEIFPVSDKKTSATTRFTANAR